MNSGRLPVNIIDDKEYDNEDDGDDEDDVDLHAVSHPELIAMVERKQRTGQWQKKQLNKRAPSQP